MFLLDLRKRQPIQLHCFVYGAQHKNTPFARRANKSADFNLNNISLERFKKRFGQQFVLIFQTIKHVVKMRKKIKISFRQIVIIKIHLLFTFVRIKKPIILATNLNFRGQKSNESPDLYADVRLIFYV